MIETKTFREIINDGYVYPNIIPQDLQATIYYWYQDRHVADDDKFPLWFTRLLKKDYEHYNQLLRIEPGVTQYDWLVTQYRELQREGLINSTEEGTGNQTDNLTVSKTVTEEGSGTDNSSVQRSNTNTVNGTKTITGTKDIDRDDNTTASSTDVTDNDSTEYTKGDVKSLQRDLPMQTLYPGPDPWYDHNNISDMLLNWETANSQAGTGNEERVTGTNDTTLTRSRTEDFGSDVKETYSDSHTDAKTTTDAGTDTKTATNSFDNSTVTAGTDRKVSELSNSKEVNANNRTREINTGREGEIARILEKAKSYIETTDAWNWLSKQIDTVFIGVYDV